MAIEETANSAEATSPQNDEENNTQSFGDMFLDAVTVRCSPTQMCDVFRP